MPATATYSPTGNVYVDGVLSGVKWAVSSLTFSFPTDPSYYGSNYGSGEPNNNFKAFTAVQQSAVRLVLQNYASVANVTFTEVTETSTQHADLRLAESNSPGTAWAYYPSTSAAGGDAWFNNSSHSYDNPTKGGYAWLTIIHELGHAMGLKHPHEASGAFGTTPVDHDSLEYSVMSYKSYVGASAPYYTNEFWGYPQSLMMLDIAALQAEYGANFATNGGDTVYSWDPNSGQMFINGAGQGAPGANRIFLTIWDGGGKDTYDFSNYSTNLTVNLQPGAWTTTSSAQLANLGDGHVAAGNIANALLYQGNPASLIENAIGGSGNDTIVGNAANNKLTGGPGNDILDGVSGTNTAVYSGNSSDYSVLHNANGSWTVADLRTGSPDGTDTLSNIQYLQFSDTTIALGVSNPSNNSAPDAVDNYYATPKQHQLVVQGSGLLANDTDPDGNALYAMLVSGPNSGTVSLNPDGSFVYTPSKKFSGIDYFTYKVSDGLADSNVATAWINVGQSGGAAPPAYNTPPVATGDSYATALGTKLIAGAGSLLANDTDADGNALSAILVSQPMYGKLKLNADGSFVYAPSKHFSGLDSFSYKVSDGWSLSNAAIVTIQVGNNTAPVATNDSYVTDQNTKLIVTGVAGLLANDTDINGDALSANLVAKPSHGKVSVNKDGSLIYIPSKNFVGVDSFSYKVSDGWSLSNVATVSISVGQNGQAIATKIDLSDDQILPPRPSKTVSSTPSHSGSEFHLGVLGTYDHDIYNHGFIELASAQPSSWSSPVEYASHLHVLHDAHLLLK
jgi:VCBS repeat-containing protein